MSLKDIDDIYRLKRINEALMLRVESAMDQQGNAFSLFQTTLNLESQVRRRTDELTSALARVEKINSELAAAKEAAEEANLSKTRFLAAASHDVLQPLNAALLSVSVLADLQVSEEGRHLTGQIERTLESMSELLGTLIDISRLDAGVMRPVVEPISLRRMLDALRGDFGPVASKKGLSLRFRQRDVLVKSDRMMLRRILQNLIANALRYTETGGVLVAVRGRQDEVVVDVIDTGPGISEDQREIIFEEFQRGVVQGVQVAEGGDRFGVGLGLSIVRRMTDALGHELTLLSRPGHGSTFRIRIPVFSGASPKKSEGENAKPATAAAIQNNVAGIRVLLLENDLGLQASMKRLLSSWQCDVETAAHGAEALEAIAAADKAPDLIIADQQLDHGDAGSEVIECIREKLDHRLPAIIVTADADGTLAKLSPGSRLEVMQKPVKPAQLRAWINHVVSSRY